MSSLKIHITAQEEEEKFKVQSPFDAIALLAAKYSELQYDIVDVDIKEKSEDFAKLTPVGTLPVLETAEGTVWQSGAIARYFADNGKNKSLRGSGSHAAQVDQVIEFVTSNVSDIVELSNIAFHGKKAGKLELKAAEVQFEKINTFLDHVLEVNTFLVGDRLSLADLVVFTFYRYSFVSQWEPEERSKIVNIARWFQTIAAQKNVKDVLGENKLKEKKEIKIESKFNLEDWKRTYMNSTPEEAIKYFWDNLDVKCNSVWISNFKFNSDLKGQELFMICNKVGGIQQRKTDFSKITFGVMAVVGTDAEPEITCLWVYENKQVPKEYQEETDYPLFDWVRVDWKKDRELVNTYLTQKDSIAGKKILDSRTFR